MVIDLPSPLRRALWPYQRDAVDAMARYISAFDAERARAALVQMPTGSGKTAIIASLARCLTRPGPVVVLTPRIGLREQLAKDIQYRLFEHAKVNAAALPHRVFELADGTAHPGPLADVVLVATVQMLISLKRRGLPLWGELQRSAALLLFDEGHYEPAEVWSEAVRSLACPRVIFTATAFRDDFRLFDIDDKHVFRYSFHRAHRDRYVRDVRIHPRPPASSPRRFMAEVAAAYDEFFGKRREREKNRPRVIIRCDRPEEIRQLLRAARFCGRSAIGIHETFDENPGRSEYRKVPAPDTTDATFWIHQFKLLEGIDDSRFQLLAMYRELRSMRALVQQIGRVIRNPGHPAGAVAHVLDHSERKRQTCLWEEFLSYDLALERGDRAALELNQRSLVDTFQKALPGLVYLDGRLRTPVVLSQVQLEALQLPLSTNILVTPARFDLETAQRAMIDYCREDELICHPLEIRSNTAAVVHVRLDTSPLLERGVFAEPRLGVSLLHHRGKYLFAFDSGSNAAAAAAQADPVDSVKLRRLFVPDARTRLTHVSMTNSNLGVDQVRARSLTAVTVQRLAPAFDEHGYVLSTATGYSSRRNGNGLRASVRRYVGIGAARVSDLSARWAPFDAWREWTAELERLLERPARTLPVFNRWASDAPVPPDPTPRNVLLDLSDVQDRYRTLGDDQPLDVSELCADVTRGAFPLAANGTTYEVAIGFDHEHQKYELQSPSLDEAYYSTDDGNTESIVRYLNRTQSLRVIPASTGYFYTLRQFCRPLIRFGPGYDDRKMGVLSSITAVPALRRVLSEKGARCRARGRGWERGSLFDLIDTLGRGTSLAAEFQGTTVMVCDDPGDECADFILVQRATRSHRKRVIFIHGKASADTSEASASALQDVCGQAVKNLAEVSLFSEPGSSKLSKWAQAWKVPKTEGVVSRRVRMCPQGSDPEREIQRTVKDPSADREVWLMLGNLLKRDVFEERLRQTTPPGHTVQLAYLLHSTISNVAAAGARLTVFCG